MPWRLENASLDFWNCAFFCNSFQHIQLEEMDEHHCQFLTLLVLYRIILNQNFRNRIKQQPYGEWFVSSHFFLSFFFFSLWMSHKFVLEAQNLSGVVYMCCSPRKFQSTPNYQLMPRGQGSEWSNLTSNLRNWFGGWWNVTGL